MSKVAVILLGEMSSTRKELHDPDLDHAALLQRPAYNARVLLKTHLRARQYVTRFPDCLDSRKDRSPYEAPQ